MSLMTECCGRMIEADERFCPKCGHECRVEDPDARPARAPARPGTMTLYERIRATGSDVGTEAQLLLAEADAALRGELPAWNVVDHRPNGEEAGARPIREEGRRIPRRFGEPGGFNPTITERRDVERVSADPALVAPALTADEHREWLKACHCAEPAPLVPGAKCRKCHRWTVAAVNEQTGEMTVIPSNQSNVALVAPREPDRQDREHEKPIAEVGPGPWQDISTAPKDGTVIIGALITDGRVWRIHDMRHNGLAFYTIAGGSLPKMTHWTPALPVPPERP